MNSWFKEKFKSLWGRKGLFHFNLLFSNWFVHHTLIVALTANQQLWRFPQWENNPDSQLFCHWGVSSTRCVQLDVHYLWHQCDISEGPLQFWSGQNPLISIRLSARMTCGAFVMNLSSFSHRPPAKNGALGGQTSDGRFLTRMMRKKQQKERKKAGKEREEGRINVLPNFLTPPPLPRQNVWYDPSVLEVKCHK